MKPERIISNKRSFLILIYFSVMPSLAGGLVSAYIVSNAAVLRKYEWYLLLLSDVLSSLFLGLGLIPTTFYSLLSGYLFGWEAIMHCIISYCLACAIGYWISGKLDNGKLEEFLATRFDVSRFRKKLEGAGFGLIALCRLSPALPFAVVNAVFAMVRFNFNRFITGSVAGMIPRTLFAVYVGRSFSKIQRVTDLTSDYSLWISILLVLVSFAGIGWILKKKFN